MSLSNESGQMSTSDLAGDPFVPICIWLEEAMTSEDLVRFPIRAVSLHGTDVKDLTSEVLGAEPFDIREQVFRRAAIFFPVRLDLELFLFPLDLFRLGGPEKLLADIGLARGSMRDFIHEPLNVLRIGSLG